MIRRILALVAAVAVLFGVATVSSAQAGGTARPTLAPTSAVRFPANYTGEIYAGEIKLWPTTTTKPTTTTTVKPTTTTVQSTTTTVQSTTTTPATSTSTSTSSTSAPPTTVAPTTAPSTTSPGSSACGISGAAFCETFDSPHRVVGTRSGDLDPNVWGVSRISTSANTDHGQVNQWFNALLRGVPVNAPDDVRIINGQLVEAVNDGEGQTILAMYPKQPWNIQGRTGTVKFDVSNDTKGAHAAWPEFWWTDQPVPAPGGPQPTVNPTALNSLGVSFAALCGYGFVGVDRMVTTKNGMETVYGAGNGVCVPAGTPDVMNHVEIQVSSGRVQVWMSTGSGPRTLVADSSFEVPLVQGVVWLEDAHYNADKFEGQRDHSFTWDNLGFDGPKTYRDKTFDVPDAGTPGAEGGQNLGYRLQPDQVLTVQTAASTPVAWDRTPTKAYVTFNWLPTHGPEVPRVRVNGGAWQELAWPFDQSLFAWRTVAVPVPFSDVHTGVNTIEIVSHGDTLAANINLTLINAAPVP